MNNDDLHDLYAGLAMQGLIASGNYSLNCIPELAQEMAAALIHEKDKRNELVKHISET